jgi:hypothetical protein
MNFELSRQQVQEKQEKKELLKSGCNKEEKRRFNALYDMIPRKD